MVGRLRAGPARNKPPNHKSKIGTFPSKEAYRFCGANKPRQYKTVWAVLRSSYRTLAGETIPACNFLQYRQFCGPNVRKPDSRELSGFLQLAGGQPAKGQENYRAKSK